MAPKSDTLPLVQVVSTCTGAKSLKVPNPLSFEELLELREGRSPGRLKELPKKTAARLYTGRQHRLLLEGIASLEGRARCRLHLLSAGYGLVPASQPLYPYEATFAGKSVREIKWMAQKTGIPREISKLLSQKADLTCLFLGKAYLQAAALPKRYEGPSPLWIFSAPSAAPLIPQGALHLPLGMPEARKYRSTLVALKGELAKRLFAHLDLTQLLPQTVDEVFALLDTP